MDKYYDSAEWDVKDAYGEVTGKFKQVGYLQKKVLKPLSMKNAGAPILFAGVEQWTNWTCFCLCFCFLMIWKSVFFKTLLS